MSDVPSALDAAATTLTIAEPSVSVWPYVLGSIATLILAGYFAYKAMSRPSFIIKQIRRRNKKAMKKQGIETSEATIDLDKLLSAIEVHATKKRLSGPDTLKLLMPLNDQRRITSAKEMYLTMQHIARDIGDQRLAAELKNKSAGVKSSSKLMAGLFKRAGI